jgi:probable rRNA maturation factor
MVLNRQRRVPVVVAPLAEFLDGVARELEFPPHVVAVRLVSDSVMAGLNRRFRKKNGPTDVLSFPANGTSAGSKPSQRSPNEQTYIGDIAIAPETARRNARLSARSLDEELRILILHGMIHLAGYDHETDSGQMVRLERRLRRRFGLNVS